MTPIPLTLVIVGISQIGLGISLAILVAGASIPFMVGFISSKIQSLEYGSMTTLLVGYTPPNRFIPLFTKIPQEIGYTTYQLSKRGNFGVMKTLPPFRFERIRFF